mgnify:CR=1 FL=1
MDISSSNSSKGKWIALIVIALIVLGVVYYYAASPAEEQSGPIGSQPAQDLNTLETELRATSVEGLDTELNDIERELAQ